MKVYFDGIIYSWQTGGGVVRYCNELLTGLAKYPNMKIDLILQEPFFNVFPAGESIQTEVLFKYPLPYWGALRKIVRKINSPINKYFMERRFKNVSEGVFHSTYYTTYNNLKIPQVLTVHDLIQERFENFFNTSADRRFIGKKRKCIEKADVIICNSETTKNDLIDWYSVPENKITVIHLGLSEAFLATPTQDKANICLNKQGLNKPYLLFVGNRGLYKNFSFLLKTFSKWNQNKEFILAVVGGRPFNLRELEEVEKLAMKDRVKILGFVDEIELNILYRNCVGFVFPSLYEGFGLPIIEALACGARVLAADIPAFKEVGGSLIDYFNPANEQSLLSALDGLVEGKHKSLDNHLRDTLIHRFDWRQTVAKTHELYDKLDKR